MMIQQFAEKHKMKTSRDECGDLIIRGKRGHLYVDEGELCAIWPDAPPMKQPRLADLGREMWQGDIGRGAHGRRVQDAWVRGISRDKIPDAIRLVGAKRKRRISDAQRASLEKARLALRQSHKSGLLCDAGDGVKV
jgi:hypothetical protein